MICQDKRWIWLEPSRLHLIARVSQGAEPDWNHEEPGKTFAETMQDEISFCTVEAFVLPAFFVFLKIFKKLSFKPVKQGFFLSIYRRQSFVCKN